MIRWFTHVTALTTKFLRICTTIAVVCLLYYTPVSSQPIKPPECLARKQIQYLIPTVRRSHCVLVVAGSYCNCYLASKNTGHQQRHNANFQFSLDDPVRNAIRVGSAVQLGTMSTEYWVCSYGYCMNWIFIIPMRP